MEISDGQEKAGVDVANNFDNNEAAKHADSDDGESDN